MGNGTTAVRAGGSTPRVLLVERDTFHAALTRATLEDAGIAVEAVATLDVVPQDALREFDVCVHRLAAACDPAFLGVGLPTVVVPPDDRSAPHDLVHAVVSVAEARGAA
jgi:hypothetical protein